MRILLVEDDETLAAIVTDFLHKQHYAVDVAIDGELGWNFLATYTYDLILLDVMLPKLDGMSLCRKIRNAGQQIPILLLTAKQTSDDKVMGLDVGADDYLVKPFDLRELAARIRAVLRRSGSALAPLLTWGELHFDPSSCRVTYAGQSLNLSNKEYSLLELFLRNSRRVLNRSMILNHLWTGADLPGEDTVKAHIKGLRRKLRSVGAAEDLIENIYGLGYRLKPLDIRVDHPTPQIIIAGLPLDLTHYLEARLTSCLLNSCNTSDSTLASLKEGTWQLLVIDRRLLTPLVTRVLGDAFSRLKQENQSVIYCLEGSEAQYLPRKILGRLIFYPFEPEELVQVIAATLHLPLHPVPSLDLPSPDSLSRDTSFLNTLIAELWNEFQDTIKQRLEVLKTAKASYISGGGISPELREEAIAEAHKLAGSLGTFGFPLGTTLARNIETLLLENPNLSPAQQEEFSELLAKLQELLYSDPK